MTTLRKRDPNWKKTNVSSGQQSPQPTAPLGSSHGHHIGATWVSQLCTGDTLWQRGGDTGAFKMNGGFMWHLSEDVALD